NSPLSQICGTRRHWQDVVSLAFGLGLPLRCLAPLRGAPPRRGHAAPPAATAAVAVRDGNGTIWDTPVSCLVPPSMARDRYPSQASSARTRSGQRWDRL